MNMPDISGELTVQIVAMPKDTNANGDIFGGWLVSYMDMGGGIEASRRARSRVATVGIDSMKFIQPVNVGDLVSCYANLRRVGTTSMEFEIEVWTLPIKSSTKLSHKKVAEGIFTYVAIDEQGKKHPVDR